MRNGFEEKNYFYNSLFDRRICEYDTLWKKDLMSMAGDEYFAILNLFEKRRRADD